MKFSRLSLVSMVFISVLFVRCRAYASTRPASKAGDGAGTYGEVSGGAVGDYLLTDQDGKQFRLKALLGKPLVVSYAYTSCTHTCTPLLSKLKGAFDGAGKDLGAEFTALTIGFDAENDTPGALKKYGMNFTKDFTVWRFATSQQKTIDDIARDTGFYYQKDESGGFEHMNLVTLVGSDGRIFKRLYGSGLKGGDVLEAIRQYTRTGRAVVAARPYGLWDKVKLFCYRYDEAAGRYTLDYGAVGALVAGTLLQGATIGWIIHVIRRKEG
ncbi:MAG: SCO family protein [Deltaproteobacteria bacterium]|nr:SCO family protein [Deltaproteobacteria bacterium]